MENTEAVATFPARPLHRPVESATWELSLVRVSLNSLFIGFSIKFTSSKEHGAGAVIGRPPISSTTSKLTSYPMDPVPHAV